MKHSTTHNIFLEIGKSHSFHFFLKQRKFLFLRFFLFIFISIFSINTNFAIEYKNLSSTILFGNEKLRPLIQRCGKPTNLQVTNITSTSAKISWTGVSGARRYRILYKKVGAPRFKIKQVNTTSINITGLKPATNYIFFVRSYCSWYNIGRSVKGTFRTLDGCDKPTNLSVEEITSTSAKLIWSKLIALLIT
ncbi:MAG: fibronectin type III domain-containing protein [Bacteroidetes bacterium]|nr:fibronectin type III domain-containing protein [Bacteroidota bacterium]